VDYAQGNFVGIPCASIHSAMDFQSSNINTTKEAEDLILN